MPLFKKIMWTCLGVIVLLGVIALSHYWSKNIENKEIYATSLLSSVSHQVDELGKNTIFTFNATNGYDLGILKNIRISINDEEYKNISHFSHLVKNNILTDSTNECKLTIWVKNPNVSFVKMRYDYDLLILDLNYELKSGKKELTSKRRSLPM